MNLARHKVREETNNGKSDCQGKKHQSPSEHSEKGGDSRKHARLHLNSTGKNKHYFSTSWLPSPSFFPFLSLNSFQQRSCPIFTI